MIRLAPDTPTVRNLARRLGVRPSTLMSRFARADLPSPKSYLAAITAAACGPALRGLRPLDRRRGLPTRVFVAPVLRAARPVTPRHHVNRVPASLPISRGGGTICNAPHCTLRRHLGAVSSAAAHREPLMSCVYDPGDESATVCCTMAYDLRRYQPSNATVQVVPPSADCCQNCLTRPSGCGVQAARCFSGLPPGPIPSPSSTMLLPLR